MNTLLSMTLAVVALLLSAIELRAERVGYQFSGALIGPSTTATMFGVNNVPRNSLISGTFSYDTTAPGNVVSNVGTFPQTISGGFTLNINDGMVNLVASDYLITVANDTGSPASDIFSIDYNYNSVATPPITPEKIEVNGTPFTGNRAYIKLQFSWDGSTFIDPDEPKLTADRPGTPNATKFAFLGDSPSPQRFFTVSSVSAIAPIAGDYNRDGKLDAKDYNEWRKAFGASQSPNLYADGNNDGAVNAADYVVWRKASAAASSFTVVPEPNSLAMVVAGLVFLFRRAMPWPREEQRH